MGRWVWIPSNSVAIALASKIPIQIGRKYFCSKSLSNTTGILVLGSTANPETLSSIHMKPSLPEDCKPVLRLPRRLQTPLPDPLILQSSQSDSLGFFQRSSHLAFWL